MSTRIPHELSRDEASGMTVNERLWVSGLMTSFDEAGEKTDIEAVTKILMRVHLGPQNIEAIIASVISNK